MQSKLQEKKLKDFILNNKGDGKPNCLDSNGVPYHIFENLADGAIDANGKTDDAIIEILHGYIDTDQIDNAKALADYLIVNGFIFDRGIVLSEISGETPDIKLKFISALKKISDITGVASYQDMALNYLNDIMEKMIVSSDAYTTGGIPTAFIVYDVYHNVVMNKRYGSYVSDCTPEVLYLFEKTDELNEVLNFLYNAQQYFEQSTGLEACFMSYYIRNLSENSPYGNTGEMVIDGILGDEKDFYHQFKTAFNIAKYYYLKYKDENKKDLKIKNILDKFLTYINKEIILPKSFVTGNFDLSSENIYLNMENILLNQTQTISIEYNINDNIYHICMVGITSLLKYLVDKEDYTYTLANSMLGKILSYQALNGSIVNGGKTYLRDQGLILQFFGLLDSIEEKSYFDIINNALRMLNIPVINGRNADIHNDKIVLDICNDGIQYLLNQRFYEFTYFDIALDFQAGNNAYNLSDLNINSSRIEQIYSLYNNQFLPLDFISYQNYLAVSRNNQQAQPRYWTENNETIYLYPKPDADYKINISHYQLENLIINFNNKPKLLPKRWYRVLKYYIAYKLALVKSTPLATFFEQMFKLHLSQMNFCDEKDLSEVKRMPSNIRWR